MAFVPSAARAPRARTRRPILAFAARGDWHPLALVALAAVWIAATANWPLWRALAALPELRGLRLAVFGGSMIRGSVM